MKVKQTNKIIKGFKNNIRHHLKLTFIPHQANQYRPHLVRRYGLGVVLLLIISTHIGYNLLSTGMVLGEKALVTPEALLVSTNNERIREQLPPLQVDSKLSQAAYLKAQDMLNNQYWAHTSPDGTAPWRWFGDVDYNYAYAGENLAKNFHTSSAVLTAWMASPDHRANIVSQNYSDIGFAVVDGVLDGEDTTIVVALYGAPASSGVVGVQQAAINTSGNRSIGPLTQLGVTVQSMSPAMVGSVMLMLIVMGIALLAHFYRRKLPKQLYNSWYRHHGIAKAGGAFAICFIFIVLYGGGQI